jgi:cyclophilin family peptidyl-prolyl cis-trans isomerase
LDNNINISKYFSIISSEIEKNKNIFYTANLVTSLKHIKSDEALIFLKNILNSKSDYRIKIAAINAMYSYDYNTVRTFIFDALNSDNFNVAIKSSEFIFDKGNSSDAAKYFEISKKLNFRQARINLLRASLKYSVNKSSIISSIISGYKASEDAYEKADFLYCLAIDPSQYQFVSEETFKTDNKIISTSGIQTLVEMRLRPDFDKIASDLKELKGEDLNLEFKAIFNEAATSDDNALIYYAALIMNKIGISYFNEFINTFFLTKALNLLVLPRDIKTYNELCKTNELANGTTCVNNWKYEPYEIDWSKISIIKGNQLVRVKTTKGDFEIMLDVNSAPASVNAFVSLVEQNYYNNTFFYINSPARAIVTSGKRGDGWLNVNIPLVCELNNLKFQEGSVAMNLLSDKFQSVNFFIATSPIIEYNDKYTVFGQVVKGMDVIHTIEVGDKILSINILD